LTLSAPLRAASISSSDLPIFLTGAETAEVAAGIGFGGGGASFGAGGGGGAELIGVFWVFSCASCENKVRMYFELS